jgi:hypothetical protein
MTNTVMNKEEIQIALDQFINESEHYHQVASNHSEAILNEVTYALQQAKGDTDLVMNLFEDSGMWRHAMCLNDITVFQK